MTRSLAALALAALATLPARAQEDEHKLIHVGAMVGPALPRPLDGEIFVKLMDLVQVGFSYSDFPNFIASPFLSAIDANNGSSTRLDDFSAYEGDLRVYPFQGAFFVGTSIGHQSLKGASTVQTPAPGTATADVQTVYVTPRIGAVWTWSSGFLLGVDGGVQLKLSSTQTVNIQPPAAANDPNLSKNINNFVNAGTSYPLPSVHFRIGWQY